ncbi:MAG: hypothetical protein ABI396_11150 [Ktedonobacteraceae bacterium]
MPTQEERLSTLERKMTNLNDVISDISHNETMLLGMAVKQGENIREIKLNLATVNERLGSFDERLGSVETTLNEHTTILSEHTTILKEHTGRFDHIETILAQILARLPEKP